MARIFFAGILVLIGWFGAYYAEAGAQESSKTIYHVSRSSDNRWKSEVLQLNRKSSNSISEESFLSCAQKTVQRGRLSIPPNHDNEEDEYQDTCAEQFIAAMEIGIRTA